MLYILYVVCMYAEESVRKGFDAAVTLTGTEFMSSLRYYATSWLPARALVQKNLEERKNIDLSGAIVKLTGYCPWKEHLHELEKEGGSAVGEVLYVLYEV